MKDEPTTTLIDGISFPQANKTLLYVNLEQATGAGFDGIDGDEPVAAGDYVVTVYDADDGGPNDYWVYEIYHTREEADAGYAGRVQEAREESPNYVQNLFVGI